ncbi:fimbria/pilus outer membrane usher protein [Acinetobacter larvae]|uniref:Fimbrial protein n=1 Tax=Acinetobacter larvae TaxID=1789224 RepID=A0A1B2LZZ9_9GAMM|nr:fimbria/pilus outer membrane usher protein [Acinetobacter larvae]AOA58512.1 hypothetical protein BFG52_09225 [Acinetobacter larvae]
MKYYFKIILLCCTKSALAHEYNLESASLQTIQYHPSKSKLYSFDARGLFGSQNKEIDLNHFSSSETITAGIYSLQTQVNEKVLGPLTIKFDHLDASAGATLCVDESLLSLFDLRADLLKQLPQKDCLTLKDLSADAYFDYDAANLSLYISLPLNISNNRPAGYIAPSQFDKGVTAAYLNYDFNVHHNQLSSSKHNTAPQKTQQNTYLGLAAGLNIAGFNFRHAGNFQSTQDTTLGQYQSYLNALSTDILALKSRLMLGEFSTTPTHLESATIIGAQLASDTNMRPMSQRSYAPLIQGIANTNALVTISQNGRILYERTVPAGSFEINDLTLMQNNGDLTVLVTENGGEQHGFIVPMQGNFNLLRVDQFNYNFAAGRYKLNQKSLNDVIAQASIEYGINNYLSTYSGANVSKAYKSLLLGLSSNTAIGGFNLESEFSKTQLKPHQRQGQKYKVAYQYNFVKSGTTLNTDILYQNKHFLSLSNSMSLVNPNELDQTERDAFYLSYGLKQRFNLSVHQNLFKEKFGTLYLRLSHQQYWQQTKDFKQYDIGYSNRWKQLSYALSINQSSALLAQQHKDRRISLSFSMPLEWKNKRTQFNSNIQHQYGQNNQSTAILGLSGVYGQHNQLNYGLSTQSQWQDHQHQQTLSTHANYLLPQMQLGIISSLGSQQKQLGLSAKGAIVAHPKGITLGNQPSETFTIIHANDAKGADVQNAWGVKLDRFGNAIYPNISAYNHNEIAMNGNNLPVDLQFKSNQTYVTPRLFSSTLIEFETKRSSNILLKVNVHPKQKIPIGTQVKNREGRPLAMFGQSNLLFIEDAKALDEQIQVKWGSNNQHSCHIDQISQPVHINKTGYKSIEVECK